MKNPNLYERNEIYSSNEMNQIWKIIVYKFKINWTKKIVNSRFVIIYIIQIKIYEINDLMT